MQDMNAKQYYAEPNCVPQTMLKEQHACQPRAPFWAAEAFLKASADEWMPRLMCKRLQKKWAGGGHVGSCWTGVLVPLP